MKRRWVSMAAAAGLLATMLLSACSAATPAGSGSSAAKEFVFAEVYPLSGAAAIYGKWATTGTDIAIEEINAAGGIQLRAVREDHQTNALTAATALQKVASVEKVSVATTMTSSPVLAMVPIAEEKKVLVINVGAQSPALAGKSKMLISNIPLISNEVPALAQYMYSTLGLKTVAILYPKDEFGQATAVAFRDSYTKLGGKVVANEGHELTAKDYNPVIAKVKAANPDGVFTSQYGGGLAVLLNQLKQQGVNKPLFATSTFAIPDVLNSESAIGAVFTTVHFDPAEAKAFADKYEKVAGEPPNVYAANAYEATYIISELVKTVGDGAITGESLRQALDSKKEFTTPLGKVTFQADGTVVKSIDIKRVDGIQKLSTIKVISPDELK